MLLQYGLLKKFKEAKFNSCSTPCTVMAPLSGFAGEGPGVRLFPLIFTSGGFVYCSARQN